MKTLGNLSQLLEKFINSLDHSSEPPPPETRTDSPHIPVKMRQYVVKRTNGYCSFPGCINKLTSLHHTQRFALNRTHDPKTIYGLCTGHERLAHLGLIKNEDQEPSNWSLLNKAVTGTAKHWIDQQVALYRPG